MQTNSSWAMFGTYAITVLKHFKWTSVYKAMVHFSDTRPSNIFIRFSVDGQRWIWRETTRKIIRAKVVEGHKTASLFFKFTKMFFITFANMFVRLSVDRILTAELWIELLTYWLNHRSMINRTVYQDIFVWKGLYDWFAFRLWKYIHYTIELNVMQWHKT